MRSSFPIFGTDDETIYNPDELLSLFLDCTADGFAIVDMENRFLRINHKYTEIFGYTEEDLIGRTFYEFSNPDFVPGIISEVQNGKAFTNMITKRFHKDGSMLDIAVSYSPFRNKHGKIIAIIAIYRDITKIVSMERELNRTRELYELITENTSDMIKVINKDKMIVYASPSHEKVISLKPEQIVGRSLSEFLSSEEDAILDKKLAEIIETGEPQILRKKFTTCDQNIVYTEYNFSPIYNEKKEIESFVSVGRNITDRVKQDATIRNLDRLSVTGQLAAGVAHEIRNPLTSLKGFSKLLQTCLDKKKQGDYLAIMMNELDRIDTIVNEFMSLAKPQAVQYVKEDLKSILDSTINIIHPQALMHNVQIITNYPEKNCKLSCNSHQLKQVFLNFLKNAIESMAEGGNIYIDLQMNEPGKVLVSVADEGAGIESDRLRYLGTPFYTTKDKGIGLGLTVSNKIIQEHNGTMKIVSEKGQGTTVIVELDCLET
ncbi:PAS domain-containing sensor histidine kinase [Mesobacillus selenatarsenatis]|uniref:histidine kinase n=1 Tax=Mesobacillus selenatarsenatis (strain DSM 18680 / JCM 14380 / FERM P-15431 / SF-1) TaxID=1321606 RepID=A0A0A8X9B5_MESS1|nr:PAS domain S-box protein [Mesobacillus selenatarsenatis]GAM15622.1 sensor histidine kinase KinD [Mesobacillus selenatarsenatis SF-1]